MINNLGPLKSEMTCYGTPELILQLNRFLQDYIKAFGNAETIYLQLSEASLLI